MYVNVGIINATRACVCPLGGTTNDVNVDGLPDNVLHVAAEFDSANGFEFETAIPSLLPQFKLFDFLNDPDKLAQIVSGFENLAGGIFCQPYRTARTVCLLAGVLIGLSLSHNEADLQILTKLEDSVQSLFVNNTFHQPKVEITPITELPPNELESTILAQQK